MIPLIRCTPPNERQHAPLREHLDTILIHRIGIGTRAADVVHAFTGGVPDAARVTGYKMPYHFVVEADGTCVQCLSLAYQGPHARKWNGRSIGIAAIGDFRIHAPPAVQWRSAVLLSALLAYPQGWAIMGHDAAPEGSSDAAKKCPGDKWVMEDFRDAVAEASLRTIDVDNFWARVRC